MKIENGEIIPGERIGRFNIGMSKEKLLSQIQHDYTEWNRGDGFCIVSIENAKFWVGVDQKVYQIGVRGEFKGKLDGKIGIGSTLREVKEKYGSYEQEKDTYGISDVGGVCFELEDVDEWEELTAPINWIFVYKI